MSRDAIGENVPAEDPEKTGDSEELPDVGDDKAVAEAIPELSEMIENLEKHGDIMGRRELTQDSQKKLPITEDPGQNEGPWAAQQPGHQERMQEAKKKFDEAKKAAEELNEENPSASSNATIPSSRTAAAASAAGAAGTASIATATAKSATISSPRASSTGRQIAKARGATPIRRTNSRDRYANKVKGMSRQEIQEMNEEQARRQEREAGRVDRPIKKIWDEEHPPKAPPKHLHKSTAKVETVGDEKRRHTSLKVSEEIPDQYLEYPEGFRSDSGRFSESASSHRNRGHGRPLASGMSPEDSRTHELEMFLQEAKQILLDVRTFDKQHVLEFSRKHENISYELDKHVRHGNLKDITQHVADSIEVIMEFSEDAKMAAEQCVDEAHRQAMALAKRSLDENIEIEHILITSNNQDMYGLAEKILMERRKRLQANKQGVEQTRLDELASRQNEKMIREERERQEMLRREREKEEERSPGKDEDDPTVEEIAKKTKEYEELVAPGPLPGETQNPAEEEETEEVNPKLVHLSVKEEHIGPQGGEPENEGHVTSGSDTEEDGQKLDMVQWMKMARSADSGAVTSNAPEDEEIQMLGEDDMVLCPICNQNLRIEQIEEHVRASAHQRRVRRSQREGRRSARP